MDTTRREFLAALGTAGAAAGAALGVATPAAAATIPAPKTAGATELTTICLGQGRPGGEHRR